MGVTNDRNSICFVNDSRSRNKRTGRVQIVRFGAKGMPIRKNNPTRQRMFFARFRPILAKVKGQKTLSPAYWAIQLWKKGFKI